MAINKVVLTNDDGTTTTLVDLTEDTVTASNLLNGITAHGADGEQITGTIESVSTLQPDLTDLVQARSASYGGMGPTTLTVNKYVQKIRLSSVEFPISAMATAEPANVLDGLTFYDTDLLNERTGTMPNIGSVSETIDPGDTYTIPEGYHNGSGTVTANAAGTLTYVNFNSQLSSSSSTSTSSVLDVGAAGNAMRYGGSLFNRGSTYTGTLTLQGSQNNSTWTDITSVTRSSGGQTSFNGTNSTYRYYRLRLGNSKSNNIACGMMMVCVE